MSKNMYHCRTTCDYWRTTIVTIVEQHVTIVEQHVTIVEQKMKNCRIT